MKKISFVIIKKVSYATLLMLIGASLTVLCFYLSRRDFVFGITPMWTQISDNTAEGLRKTYKDEQEGIWLPSFRLRTVDQNMDKVILKGFWIDSAMLKNINAANEAIDPTVRINGYHVYFGKYDTADRRHYALVVRASHRVSMGGRDINKGVGPYYDFVDPCPDNCGD